MFHFKPAQVLSEFIAHFFEFFIQNVGKQFTVSGWGIDEHISGTEHTPATVLNMAMIQG